MGIISDDNKLKSMREATASVGIRDASKKLAVLFDELLAGVE